MTILTVLLLTVVSTCLAQPADEAKDRPSRAPQSQIQYSNPEGSKVDWKLYAPQNQWRSHLESSRRLERAEAGTGQPNYGPKQQQQGQVVQAPVQIEPQYQPYSSVPSHIKKLIVESYNHQGPYVDPGAFFYQAVIPTAVSALVPQEKNGQYGAAAPTHQLEREYFASAVNYRAAGHQPDAEQYYSGGQVGRVPPKAGIKYADEERLSQRSTALPYGSVIGAQPREKLEYQAYKQVAQHQQFNRKTSEGQAHFAQHRNRDFDSQSQYSQQNSQNSQIHSPFGQFNKQASPGPQHNKPISQSKQYKEFDSVKPTSESHSEHDMPMAIQQLLSYQAQLPYNVIANHIIYRPKQLFIPKPLPESAKLAKQYPSKIYFLKTDGQIYDSPEVIKDQKNHEKGY
ncbi:uncharacterized protein [Venturia canescens]|uniref:uncharacterized protein n=1 Tax=Venturia canescens TaxID=32260 RepID=UPI001C9C7D76|nr:uncharacterized protein LOC122405915 [Venturia canescens]